MLGRDNPIRKDCTREPRRALVRRPSKGETVGIKRNYVGGLLMACLGISQLTGCCCDDPCASCPSVSWDSPCHGYHSTCWRPWPEECLTCPAPIWSPASAAPSKESDSVIAPEVPREPMPLPVNPEPQPIPPQAEPEKTPKSVEPSKNQGTPVPDSPPKSNSGNGQPQIYQSEYPSTNSSPAVHRASGNAPLMPPPVVVEVP